MLQVLQPVTVQCTDLGISPTASQVVIVDLLQLFIRLQCHTSLTLTCSRLHHINFPSRQLGCAPGWCLVGVACLHA